MRLPTLIIAATGLCWGFQEEEKPPIDIADTMTVVYAPEDFHARSEATAPVLIYQKAFFQRFEPLSVGDILKRLPGIAGFSDAGEFDQPQLRGIGPQYTQILVNGERLPGAGNDRTLTLERIPAHLVERVEIVRSPAASADAQGIGGTINIVLADGRGLGGLDALVGLSHFESDSKQRGQAAVAYSGAKGRLSYSVNGALHRRHNPKSQTTDIREAEGGAIFKDEVNILDAVETALTGSLRLDFADQSFLEGRFMALDSDRSERETASFAADGEIEERIFDFGEMSKQNWGAQVRYERPGLGFGGLRLSLSHHVLEVDDRLDIGVIEEGELLFEELETDRTRDQETKLGVAISIDRPGHVIELGVDAGLKDRDARARLFEIEDDELVDVEFGGVFRIEEERLDFYVMDTWAIGPNHDLQAGLRLEHTEMDMVEASLARRETELFPSIHYAYRPSDRGQWRVSLARTVKRPDFMDLQPFLQRDQPFEDRNTMGNPDLKPEFAVGLDIGYEQRFREFVGVIGLNFFYRDVRDHVETVQISEEAFQIRNIGDGEVYGFELDLGMPLHALGAPNVSVFGNLTLMDSTVTDPHSGRERPFNLQPDSVFNFGLIHAFPSLGMSYGATWLSQGTSEEILLDETAAIDFGDNLELLLEKRWRRGWSLRLTARNLLDATRDKRFQEFEELWTETEPSQTAFESERSGRSYLLTLRGVFGRRQP